MDIIGGAAAALMAAQSFHFHGTGLTHFGEGEKLTVRFSGKFGRT
jgi:hypothetical protein